MNLAFSLIYIVCWGIGAFSLLCWLIVLLLREKSQAFLIVAVIFFSLPFVIYGFRSLSSYMNEKSFIGEYKSSFDSIDVNLAMSEANMFKLKFNDCNVSGSWKYVNEYEACLMYSENYTVSFYESLDGNYILNVKSNSTNCTLEAVKLIKN